jgi:hypothetical protein
MNGAYGLVVMIAAFQAAERGSIPRARKIMHRKVFFLPALSWFRLISSGEYC